MKNRILVVSAHPDDEVLGVGGTIRKKVNQGNEAYCIIAAEGITSRNTKESAKELKKLHEQTLKASKIIGYKKVFFLNLPDNRMDSINLLDIIKKIEEIIEKIKPQIVYTHDLSDLNIDHRICFKAVMVATRPTNGCCVNEIYTFETLSSTEWQAKTNKIFQPNTYEDISNEIESKINALKEYKGEIRNYPHPRSERGVRILAKYRGLESGLENAEAFCLIRRIIK
ncbi:GlcNAc-PI de-N-acetylase [Euryarchaeota archaeon SM23-78]|nr:MAG: GlcNAc-PI de-N-acetylase [Euryarchaeota archaeon SM23-78]MBW3000349.1 PIG-L family deacetylase [Candidatus Woesearchaeota archaeon]